MFVLTTVISFNLAAKFLWSAIYMVDDFIGMRR